MVAQSKEIPNDVGAAVRGCAVLRWLRAYRAWRCCPAAPLQRWDCSPGCPPAPDVRGSWAAGEDLPRPRAGDLVYPRGPAGLHTYNAHVDKEGVLAG